MILGNNGGFSLPDMAELFGATEENFFTATDVSTILGKNLVKNFVAKIGFELGMFGYSETSLDIIDFYEQCKKNGGIVEFQTNKVVKMIKDEMNNNSNVRMYLNDRIFNEIQEEIIKCYEDTFNKNDELYTKIQNENQDFMEQKELERKAIKKIQKELKCDEEKAREIYNKNKNLEQAEKGAKDIFDTVFGIPVPSLPMPLPKKSIKIDDFGGFVDELNELNKIEQELNKSNKKENSKTKKKKKESEIELNEKPSNTNDEDNFFWSL